jgi:colanic acid/amylovoran biosynthesis glycosyltransferase
MSARGSLLLVIPTVLELEDTNIRFDGDFSNNVEAYLREFDTVTVACPAHQRKNSFPSTKDLSSVAGNERLNVIVLPEPYREDRYFINRGKVRKLLKDEIDKSEFVLISPHAAFDWSTLAAEICIEAGKKYNMEADWNLPQVTQYIWQQMPFGLNKFRKFLWQKYHNPKYLRCLKYSSLSLVQGEDVYNEYRKIAPNAFPVLNIQITDKDKISRESLDRKITAVERGAPLKIIYAGRAAEMKGPMEWLAALEILKKRGIEYHASWYGDGELLTKMKSFIHERGLSEYCDLLGNADRETVFSALQSADIFLFCHMTKESPRCLVEALAAAAPLVGFGTDYSRSLVRKFGGGAFVERGDVTGLADLLQHYSLHRHELASLIRSAADSGQALDRDIAISERISLMKQYLKSDPAKS